MFSELYGTTGCRWKYISGMTFKGDAVYIMLQAYTVKRFPRKTGVQY